MDSEMLLLGQALFAMALYTSKPTARVENCEFGVSLHDDRSIGSLHISFFLKEPETEESQSPGITWKDIASPKGSRPEQTATSDLLPKAPIVRLLSLAFGKIFGKKKSLLVLKKEDTKPINLSPNASKQEIMGSYSINTRAPEWAIIDEAFPITLIKLLPTATALVQAELDLMQQSTIDDIVYVEAFESEAREE